MGGIKSTSVSQSGRETSRDAYQNVLSTQKLFKTRDLELPIFRDLSQFVRRTPRDTPVLQFLECCTAETALQHSLFCSADVICTKSCAAANEKLHCNIEIAALHESGAFLPLSCGFQAPTFRHPRVGLADFWSLLIFRGLGGSRGFPKSRP